MSICPRCSATFTCAMAEKTGQPCWCAALPVEQNLPIYPDLPDENASCFCPVCLQEWHQNSARTQEP